MEVFKLIRFYFTLIGIYSPEFVKNYPKDWTSVLSLVMLSVGIVTTGTFLCFDAKTFGEFSSALINLNMFSDVAVDVVILVIKTDGLFKFMQNFDDAIQKRE